MRIKFAGFLLFCAVALPVKMGMDGKLNKGYDYLAMAILDLVLLIIPAALLIIFGRKAAKRTALVIKTARARIEAGGQIGVAEMSREMRLNGMVVRGILD